MSPIIISALVFLGVTCLIGLFAFVFRDQGPQTATRLDMLIGKKTRQDQQAADILKKTAFESDQKSFLESIMPKYDSLEKYFEQADCHIKPSTLFGVSLLLSALAAAVTWIIKLPWWLMPINAAVLFVVPWIWLWWKREARMAKFQQQLPEALELVARALRSGQSLAAALHVVGEEMPEPISVEFGRVFEEQNLGIPIEEALRNLADRVPNMDLKFFVTSVAIQRTTGGDLAEILDKIGYVIRERFKILGQVMALTGEGRLSGVVLISLPFALFGFLLNTNPGYVSALWTTPLGIQMSIAALVAQVIGALVIRYIINIEV
jgi:tight adherence protein B